MCGILVIFCINLPVCIGRMEYACRLHKCRKKLPYICGSFVDGEVNSPATTTPTRFHLNPMDSGREICKVAIFSSGRKLPLRKNLLLAAYTPPLRI